MNKNNHAFSRMKTYLAAAMLLLCGYVQAAEPPPDADACRKLIHLAFFYHAYEQVCQESGKVGLTLSARFERQQCPSVLSDAEMKQLAAAALSKIKAEMDDQQSQRPNVTAFCTNHISEYQSIREFQQSNRQ